MDQNEAAGAANEIELTQELQVNLNDENQTLVDFRKHFKKPKTKYLVYDEDVIIDK